jgi:hypothetical protein
VSSAQKVRGIGAQDRSELHERQVNIAFCALFVLHLRDFVATEYNIAALVLLIQHVLLYEGSPMASFLYIR